MCQSWRPSLFILGYMGSWNVLQTAHWTQPWALERGYDARLQNEPHHIYVLEINIRYKWRKIAGDGRRHWAGQSLHKPFGVSRPFGGEIQKSLGQLSYGRSCRWCCRCLRSSVGGMSVNLLYICLYFLLSFFFVLTSISVSPHWDQIALLPAQFIISYTW